MGVTNIFHCAAENIGDRMCGPGQYLWPSENKNLRVSTMRTPSSKVVVGGGQIFSQLPRIVAFIKEKNPKARIVGWGVGLPTKRTARTNVEKVTSSFDAFGTRNYQWRNEVRFVPCGSCLSTLFDNTPEPTHEVVIFEHCKKTAPENAPNSIPVMRNDTMDAASVINFLASGETIVTSSYHGVYWAQLLGRKVICIPYNDKFETFQYLPKLAEPDNWKDCLASATNVEPLLEEYRSINIKYYHDILNIFEDSNGQ